MQSSFRCHMVRCPEMESHHTAAWWYALAASFIGCIGVLMENSGCVPWLQAAFAGVPKMLSRKKFPMNVRALRFAVLEMHRGFVDNVGSFGELQRRLAM